MAKKSNASPDTTSSLPKGLTAKPASSRRKVAKTSVVESSAEIASASEVKAKTEGQPKISAAARHRKDTVIAEPADAVVSSQAAPTPEAPIFHVTHEAISRLAFSYFERRGYRGGSPEEDWHRAEQELLALSR